MPYKDKEKRNKASKDSMERKRKGLTTGVNKEGVNIEMIPASFVQGLNGRMYETLPKRPRYLTLSDGQVLDRLNQPEPNINNDAAMQACNESSYNYKPRESSKETIKALEKAVKG